MPLVTITVPMSSDLVDLHDVRLAAKKTLTPGATDAHGTAVESIGGGATSTTIVVRVAP